MKKFVIASGGTGGHFYPGFALGTELRKRGHGVLFVVRKQDIAIKTLVKNNFEYKEIDLVGFPRSINPFRHIAFCYKFVKAFFQSAAILNAYKPDVCVGMGGYLSFPIIVISYFKNIKNAVHDSNTKLGLANKLSAKFTKNFLLGLPTSDDVKNTTLVGTPIRAEFAQHLDRDSVLKDWGLRTDLATILVFGGSQGSKNLNLSMSKAAKKVVRKNETVQFVHISGDKGYERLRNEYRGIKNIKLLSYCHEIYALMQAADIVVCRSGASTIAELYALQKPAVFVPFPHAAGNHQYYNALLLKKAGCAELFVENRELSEKLYNYLLGLSRNKNILEFMVNGYQNLELPDPLKAAQIIADKVESL